MSLSKFKKAEFFTRILKENPGYSDIREVADNNFICIVPYMFTHAIIKGRIGNTHSFDDRWCYSTYEKAKAAIEAWDGSTGEPEGWHRHPLTGRRRIYDEESFSEHVNM